MPVLAFKVQADWEKVVRLREEITKLKAEMRGIDAVNSPAAFNTLNQRLKQCTTEFNSLTTEAVHAGAKIESGFKKKIFDAQQVVNGLSEEIIKQRKIVADTTDDLKKLTEQYRNLKANGQNLAASDMLPKLNKVKSALDEQKYALFELTQERAKEQISVKKLREEYQLFAKDSDAGTDALAKMKSQLLGMGKGLLAGMGLKELAADIIRVRGQFQQADTAIATLLGSEERAKDLLSQVREYAKISPLEFGDITAATQMMLGFNIEAEKVPGFIKAIGDVSMGESSRFNSLTLAFSQMSATGKLMGQDLNQMINAGFNPLQVMSEKTGKSIAQLKEEMSKGAITSEMVQQAFIDATSAGGKFFNMSENAAKTINGQLSMMHDAIDSALNDIGTTSEGMIVGTISGITKLIENYETVGRVLLGLATTYGTYRTAVALVTFAQNGHTLAMTMARAQILLTQKAQALLNATMLANPYVLAAVALGTLVGAAIATSDGLNAAERAQRNFNDAIDEGVKKQEDWNQKTEEAIANANSDAVATEKRQEAMDLLIQRYPTIIQKYIDEEGHLQNILQLKREIAELDGQRSLEDLNKKTKRYSDVNEITKLLRDGKPLSKEQQELYAEVKKEYFDSNNWTAKALYNDNDLMEWTEAMAKNYKQQASRQNAQNAVRKFRESIAGYTEAQLKQLQNTLQNAKSKKGNVVFKGFGDLNGAVLNQGDIAGLDKYVEGLLKAKGSTVVNKDALTKRKKKLQAELDALSVEEAAGQKGKDLKKKIQAIDKQLGTYSTSSSHGGKGGKGTTADDIEEKRTDVLSKQKLAQERADKDLEFSTREAQIQIKAMQDGTDKVLEQLKLDRERKEEAIRRSYEDMRLKRIEEARKVWEADPKNKGENFYESSEYSSANVNTKAETDNRDARLMVAKIEYNKAVKELRDADLQSMREYLKEYGTLEQQVEAITKEYQDKIDKARSKGDEGAVLLLEKKMQEAISKVKLDNLIKAPEFIKAFEDLGNVSTETIERMIGKFEDVKEEAAKNLKPDQLREYTDTLERMHEELRTRDPFKALTDSLKELKAAHDDIGKWEDIIVKIKAGEVVKDEDGNAIEMTQAEKNLSDARNREIKATNNLKKSIADVANSLSSFSSALKELGNEIGGKTGEAMNAVGGIFDSFSSVLNGVKNFDSNAKGIQGIMGKVSLIMTAATAMIQMNKALDSILPDEESLYNHYAAKWKKINDQRRAMIELEMAQLEERLKNEAWFYENGMTQLKRNAELNEQMFKAYGEAFAAPQEVYQEARSGFSKWGPAIIGAIVGIIIGVITYGSGAAAGVAAGTSIAGALGGGIATAVGISLTSTMASILGSVIIGGVSAAVANAIRAGYDSITYKDGQTAAADNLRVQTRHKTFFRSEKTQDLESWVRENWGEELWDQEFAEKFGKYGVKLIDPEVAKKLLEDGPTLVGETEETVKKLMEYSEKIHEFLDQIHEYVSQAFSPLVDNLSDALWDWLADGKDVMDSFRDYAADTFRKIAQDAIKAMITKNIFDPFQEQLEGLLVAYSTGQTIDGVLIDEAGYMLGVSKIAEEMQKKIEEQMPVLQHTVEIMDSVMKYIGIDITGKSSGSQQTATSNAIQNITQDQANALEGRVTAMQIAVEQGNTKNDAMLNAITLTQMMVTDLRSIATDIYDIADDTRDILANSYLELRDINDHQGKIEKAVVALQSDVQEMKNDIKDLR